MRLPPWLARHVAATRMLLVLTVLCGLLYPLAVTAVVRIPGLAHRADGSPIRVAGTTVGSALIGQSFADTAGEPSLRYLQPRPSAAGDGYDPTATGASNLGPEDVVDSLPDPADPGFGRPSLLTLVCSRSRAIGEREGVDGSRPYCTPSGVGAVLGVHYRDGFTGPVLRVVSLNEACPAVPFLSTYGGRRVECARSGEDHSRAVVVPVRGVAPAHPAVPADAVTAGGSGLDPHISPAYAELQAPRLARIRGADVAAVRRIIETHTSGCLLGFLGEPRVDVLGVNLELDRRYPLRG